MKAGDGATKTINLALQGGGAHGAFTWGVLDRLLEDERLNFEGISGTSAGAINGAILMQGWVDNGRAGARQALDAFWRHMAQYSIWSPVQRSLADRLDGNWNLDQSPAALSADFLARLTSPYQTNPLGLNPLRHVLLETIKIDKLHACTDLKLFVTATSVRSGKARVFEREEISVDALLASACLPNAFQAVEIDGQPYWDGGYMGNPSIWPLIYNCDCPDVAIVQINPLTIEGTPRSAAEITNRLNEITFNASLMREMRAIAFVQKLLSDSTLAPTEAARLKRMNIHMIGDETTMRSLGVASKFNIEGEFLELLRSLGRTCAEQWLTENFAAIGNHSSIDIREKFL